MLFPRVVNTADYSGFEHVSPVALPAQIFIIELGLQKEEKVNLILMTKFILKKFIFKNRSNSNNYRKVTP